MVQGGVQGLGFGPAARDEIQVRSLQQLFQKMARLLFQCQGFLSSLYIYIYIYVFICMYLYIYIYCSIIHTIYICIYMYMYVNCYYVFTVWVLRS